MLSLQVLRRAMPGRQVQRTTQIFRSLLIEMDERRVVKSLGVVVASTDGRTGKDDADLSPEDGRAVR